MSADAPQDDVELNDVPVPEQELRWGAQLADTLNIFANISWFLRDGGLDHDPSTFIELMKSQNGAGIQTIRSLLSLSNSYYAQLYTAHEALQAKEQKLQHEYSRVRNEMTTNHALIAELRNTVQVISTSGGGGGGHGRKSKDPDKFTGEEKEPLDRQYNYTIWKSALRLCHAMDPHHFADPLHKAKDNEKPSERLMVLHIIGCMGGKAHASNKINIDLCIDNPEDTASWQWKTRDEVWKSLDQQYITINLKLEANRKFDNLFQKNQPYSNFITEFHLLSTQAGKTKSQQVEALKKKVSNEIAEKFATLTDKPGDEDFEGWVEKGAIYAENLAELHHNQKAKGKGNGNMPYDKNTAPQPPPQKALTTSQGGDAMDLDQLRLAYTRMTPEDREYCRRMGLCYYCRDDGHVLMQCEKKKAADARAKNNGGGYQGGGGRGGGGAGRGGGSAGHYPSAPYYYPGQVQRGRGGFPAARGNGRGGFTGRGGFPGGRGGYSGGHLRSMETQDEYNDSAGQWVWTTAALPTPASDTFHGFVEEGSVAGSSYDADAGKV